MRISSSPVSPGGRSCAGLAHRTHVHVAASDLACRGKDLRTCPPSLSAWSSGSSIIAHAHQLGGAEHLQERPIGNAAMALRIVAGGSGGRAIPDQPHGAGVRAAYRRRFQQRVQHRRHQHRVGGALGFDQVQRPLRIPAADDHRRTGVVDVAHHVDQRDASRRHRVQPAAAGINPFAERDVEDGGRELLVVVHRALREPGRSGRVGDHGDIVR